MGQAEQRIIRECYRRHKPLPDRIENAPDLLLGLELYFEAFVELNTCRSTGWSAGPIPAWCVAEYSSRIGLSGEEAEDLHYHVRAMDSEFLKHVERQSRKKA